MAQASALESKIPDNEYALEYSVFDVNNPKSLINVCPEDFYPVMQTLRERYKKIAAYSERELKKSLKPEERDSRIRMNFWNEYHLSTSVDKRMSIDRILSGVTTRDTWDDFYLHQPNKLLWILTPPRRYVHAMEELLSQATDRLYDILELPITYKKSGEPNTAMIAQILKVYQLIDLRVKGAILQRVQISQTSQNLNMNIDPTAHMLESKLKEISNMSLDQLMLEAKKLNRSEKQLIETLPQDHKERALALRDSLDKFPEKVVVPLDSRVKEEDKVLTAELSDEYV